MRGVAKGIASGRAVAYDGVHGVLRTGKIWTSMTGKSQVSDPAFRLRFGFRDFGLFCSSWNRSEYPVS